MIKKLIRFFTAPVPNFVIAAFLGLLIIYGCSSVAHLSKKEIHPDLQPYVADYYKLLNEHCKSGKYRKTDYYAIEFRDSMFKIGDREIIGYCYLYRVYGGYRIEISRKWWDKAIEQEKRQLLYHELSHCLIDKDHINDENHYMNPDIELIAYKELEIQVILDIVNYCQ